MRAMDAFCGGEFVWAVLAPLPPCTQVTVDTY